tara:strand:+ start:1510 stop:1662 length:153 start_codon:yes stop_codon:yes gene_type:complete
MKSFQKWIETLFEGMAIAFVHPIRNNMPPEIGTHSYRDKPYRKQRKLRFN